MKTTAIALLLICVAAFAQQKGTFTDARDKKTYKTVKIGEQTWMAENLNYADKNSKCYDNKPANCAKHGRLYWLNTALKACPKGWHLPDDDEWQVLVDFAGGGEKAGAVLKSASGWNNNDNGTDEFGFSALPGGYGNADGGFSDAGGIGLWWSASEHESNYAFCRGTLYSIDYGGIIFAGINGSLFSVRCLKD